MSDNDQVARKRQGRTGGRRISLPRRAGAELVDIQEFRRIRSLERQNTTPLRARPGIPPRVSPPRRSSFFKPQITFLIFVALCLAAYIYFSPVALERRVVVPVISPISELALFEPPQLLISTRAEVVRKIKRGETTPQILNRSGLTQQDFDRAFAEIGKLPLDTTRVINPPITANSRLSVGLAPAGEVSDFKLKMPSGEDLVVSFHQKTVDARLIRPESREPDHVVLGEIRSSFAADGVKAGISSDVIDDLVDLFSDRVEFRRDFQPGDRFSVIFGSNGKSGSSSGISGTILAAALEVNGETFVAARYVGSDGKARYFDEKGNLLGNTFLRFPVKFSRISSYFTDSRLHPVLKVRRPHLGVDFAAPVGTAVRSVAAGKVIFAGYKGPNGNMVQIRHNDRYTTAYLHLSKITSGVTKGSSIAKGEMIGAVGCTGLCSGPHLHYGFYDRGKYVDPLKTKLPTDESMLKGLQIEKTFLERVLFTLDHYQQMAIGGLS